MRNIAEFNEALEKLNQELDAMSGEEFFAMFGLNLNDLPPDISEPQYSLEFILKSAQDSSPIYRSVDLKCA